MKKTVSTFIGVLAITLTTVVGCKKQEVVPEPETPTSGVGINNLIQEHLDQKVQHFSVDANSYGVIYGDQGTKIVVSGNNFTDENGNPITGMVDIELVELYSLTEMITCNKVTMGMDNGQLAPLSSGGELYLSVTQNGTAVTIANPLTITTSPATPASNNMKLFNGSVNTNGDILWTLDNPATLPSDSAAFGNILNWAGDYNWVNCDFFFTDPNPQTSVTVNIPSYCNTVDTRVFVAVPSETMLTWLSSTSLNAFGTGSWYTLPEGLDINTVVLTVHNGVLKYGIDQSTIGTNHVVNISSLTEISSLDDLEVVLAPYF